jgi:hypothetical protein
MGFTDNLNLQGAEGDLEALAKKLGAQVLGQVKDAAGAAWAEVPDEGKKILERASVRMGKLILRRTAGEDVTQPMADVEAQLANCQWAGSALMVRNFWSTVAAVAQTAAQVAGAGLAAMAAGAMGRVKLPEIT